MEGSSSAGASASTSAASTSSATTASSSSPSQSAAPSSAPSSGSSNTSQTSTSYSGPELGSRRGSFGSESTETAAQPTETAAQAAAARELGDSDLDALVSVKINGEMKKLTLREVQKGYQLESAARQRMQQAQETQRKFEQLLQSDLAEIAKQKGVDLEAHAEELLAKKYELMQMSPEQRRLHEYETREAQEQARIQQTREGILGQIKELVGDDLPPGAENASPEQLQAFFAHQKQLHAHTQKQIDQEFVAAWNEVGLPQHPFFGAKMAFEMMSHQKRNAQAIKEGRVQPLQAKEVAAKLKTDFMSHVSQVVSQMDAQAIQELLGKDTLEKLRVHDVNRVTANSGLNIATPNQSSPSQSTTKKQLNQSEWRKAMGIG